MLRRVFFIPLFLFNSNNTSISTHDLHTIRRLIIGNFKLFPHSTAYLACFIIRLNTR